MIKKAFTVNNIKFEFFSTFGKIVEDAVTCIWCFWTFRLILLQPVLVFKSQEKTSLFLFTTVLVACVLFGHYVQAIEALQSTESQNRELLHKYHCEMARRKAYHNQLVELKGTAFPYQYLFKR